MGAYASKRRAEMIQQQVEDGVRVVSKAMKKQTNAAKAIRRRKSNASKVSIDFSKTEEGYN